LGANDLRPISVRFGGYRMADSLLVQGAKTTPRKPNVRERSVGKSGKARQARRRSVTA